eukprot:9356591-Alexandrium_andersonii.AAC.1
MTHLRTGSTIKYGKLQTSAQQAAYNCRKHCPAVLFRCCASALGVGKWCCPACARNVSEARGDARHDGQL